MGGVAFAEFERAGWERAAPRYEVCWTDTVLFVEALLDAAAVRAGSGLLDVACGPGFVSEAAAARGARPVGVDVAAAMVERARARCPDLAFVVGDALRLPFPDASFDAVTINFGSCTFRSRRARSPRRTGSSHRAVGLRSRHGWRRQRRG